MLFTLHCYYTVRYRSSDHLGLNFKTPKFWLFGCICCCVKAPSAIACCACSIGTRTVCCCCCCYNIICCCVIWGRNKRKRYCAMDGSVGSDSSVVVIAGFDAFGSTKNWHCDLKTHTFPNIRVLLQVSATRPSSTASNERSFSALKRLKTNLRATMREERLTGLALLHIHQDIVVSIDQIIDRFANLGPHRLAYI